MEQKYRPKNKRYIKRWLRAHRRDREVVIHEGRLSYLRMTPYMISTLRDLTGSLGYYFERVDYGVYALKNIFDYKRKITIAEYMIHDDLMEVIEDELYRI